MARKTTAVSVSPTISAEKALNRLKKLLDHSEGLDRSAEDSPNLNTWRQNVEGVLSQHYGQPSLQFDQFNGISYSPGVFSSATPQSYFDEYRRRGIENAKSFVQSRINELEEDVAELKENSRIFSSPDGDAVQPSKKVFVVHGHDDGLKETVARFLQKLGLEPIILHEQADQGRTIIEKFEHYSDVATAVILLSGDDLGHAKSNAAIQEIRADRT